MFYRIDSSRVSLEEYRWGTPGWQMPLALLLRTLRVRIPSSTDDPNVEAITPFEITAEKLPDEVRDRLLPLAGELEELGFVDPLLHTIRDPNTATRIDWATFRHLSGRAVARLHHRQWAQPQPPRRHLFAVFLSALDDGRFVLTSGGKPDLLAPAAVRVERRVGASAAELWAHHKSVLAAEEAAGRSVVAIPDDQAVRELVERHHRAVRDFHLARGVFRPLRQAEQAATAKALAAVQSAEARGERFAEEIAEIERLERGGSSWVSGLLLLVVSVGLFLGLGAASWSLEVVLALIPILLLHEAGHFVAMRLFDYQNVRMFFIPLFGAAVVGRNRQAAGWKRVLVSLAGPLPGIALALPVAMAADVFALPVLDRVALMMVILNVLNLLPLLPLDGGWVLQTLLFSRHPALDVAFRGLAVLGLIGLGIATGDRILGFLAIPLAVGLPAQWQVAKLAAALRREQLPLGSPGGGVPRATLERILERLGSGGPPAARRLAAQQALAVVDTLGAEPPDWAATLGLLALYVASFVGAAVIVVMLALIGVVPG
jgi:Zn-dependent protease